MEIDRARVYCPAEVLRQEGGWEEEAAQAETIYLGHEEQLGREASAVAAFQGQVRCEEGLSGAKAAAVTASCLPTGPAASPTSRPTAPAPSRAGPAPRLHVGLPFPGRHPPGCRFCLS